MWLRAIGAAVTLASVGWLAFVLRNWVGLLFGALGTLFGFVWMAMIAAARRRARSVVALRLLEDRFEYEDGRVVERHAWSEVERVEVDEERLSVAVTLSDGRIVHVEPHFRGVGVYDLEHAVSAARTAARPDRPAR